MFAPWKETMANLDSTLKSRHYFADKGLYSQSYGVSSSHVWMWELDHKESWALNNWCFWTVVLEKTLESPLDCKEVQPVHSEGDQPRISLKGMMLKLKLQYFGHLTQRVDSLEKSLMLGGIVGRRRRGRQRMRLDCKEIQLVNPKGNQSWIFIGRTDAEAETPILCPHDVKNWLIGKDPDAGQDWRQEEKGMTEDEMVAWHHWYNGH